MLELPSNSCAEQRAVMRLRAITDADPRAPACILQYLHARNIVPKSLSTVRFGRAFSEITIEVAELSGESFRRIIDEIDDMPMVIAAVPFDVDWAHAPARA